MIGFITLAAWLVPLRAAEPDGQTPLEYRRYFVPADRPESWPKRKVPYLPVDRDEFERLVEAANSVPLGKPVAGAARVTQAVYEAKLTEHDRLTGEARLEISATQNTPALLPLEPFSIVVESAAWQDSPDTPAVVGLDAQQRFSVLVERPGTLVVRWSLVGRREPAGSLVFPLELPRAPVARMQLDLPQGVTPALAAGVRAADGPAGDGRRWEFELGGRTEASLVLAPDEDHSRHRRLTLLQEHVNYRFTPGGLEVAAQLRLDIHHEPLRRLELDLDGGLRLVAAQQGGTQVAWTVAEGQAAGSSRATLEFAEPLLGPGRLVTVTALAPLVLEQSWTLPRVRVQGVFWQEGSISLIVPAPLSLDQLLPLRCRQSTSGPLASARPSDTYELQLFSPDASAKVLFSWRKRLPSLSAATTVELSGDSWQADVRGRFELDEGETFVLSAGVGERWLVDSVISNPPGAVSTWNVEETDAGRSLVVQLAEPLAPSRPVELRVGGRRAAASDETFSDAALRMVEFHDVAIADHLLALAPAGPYRLRFAGAELPRLLRPNELTARQRKLIGDSPLDTWIDLNLVQPGWAATLRSQTPRYTAELVVDALLDDQRLIETYLLRCKPDAARLDRVLIHFGQSRPTPPRWTADADLGPLTATRLTPPPVTERPVAPALAQVAPALVAGTRPEATGETWEVRLAHPSEKPFELHASRETAWQDHVTLSLAAVDGAASQQATLRIRADDALPEIATSDRLTPLPLGSATPDHGVASDEAPLRAVYRYDPLTELGLPPPAVAVYRSPPNTRSSVVWKLRLHSQYSSSGRALHTAEFQLQNQGQRLCEFRLPAEVELLAVRIDGVEARAENLGDGWRVTLPRRQEFTALSVEYASSGRPLGLVGRCDAVWPEIDLPVMSRIWAVRVPPAYGPWNRAGGEELDWRRRLFGPLARSAGESFNPQPAYNIEFGDEPARAWVVHRGAVAAARWAILAVVAGIGLSMRRRPAAWIVLGGLSAIAALWLPDGLAPLASGVWLGVLVSFVGPLWRPRRSQRPLETLAASDRAASSDVPSAAVVSGVLLIILAFGLATARFGYATAAADEPSAPRGAEAADADGETIHRVFIPVDSEGKPGTRYQVPTEFLQALRRRAGAAAEQPRGWLLSAARYHCTLGRDENDARLEVRDLSVEYELRVFEGGPRIELPFDRGQASLDIDSATLDRQPIELAWDDAGQSLVCDLEEPGDYVLQFRLQPKTTDRGETTGFELAVPRVPSARLELTSPEALPIETPGARGRAPMPTMPTITPEALPIETPGARGAIAVVGDGRHLSVELGPTAQLAVRWPQKALAEAPLAEVEELLWLKVQPGSVVLNVHLNYKVTSGVLRRVELAADHRLWRIPGGEDASPAFTEQTLPGDPMTPSSPQLVQLDLDAPVGDRLSLDLSWLLTGSSGVGNLRLPVFQALGARPVKRWLAVTVDSGLEYDVHNDERLEGLPPTDFAAAWAGPEAALLRDALAYRLSDAETAWSLATRPREPRTTVKENLALSFDRAGALVEYDAQLRTTAGFVFEHRLLVPQELRIDQVSLEEDGAERAARWARGDSDVVTVFLNRRVTGAQRLLVRGRLPPPPEGRLPLPVLTIEPGDPDVTNERAKVLSRTVRVFRQPSVAVTLSGARSLVEAAELAADPSSQRLGRLVAAYNASPNAAAMLTVAPNEPQVHSVTQLTALRYLDPSWTARCHVQFTVDDGVLDAVRFDLPANWGGPFEVAPAATIEVFEQPGNDRKQLVVRPRSPLHGRAALTLEAPLKAAPGEPVAAPDLIATSLPDAERFLALPSHVGLEPVSWETSRLVAAPLPDSLAGDPPKVSRAADERPAAERKATFAPSEPLAIYRAVGDNPQAVLSNRALVAARVRLADFGLSFDGQAWRAVAAFDVEPGGATRCPLRLSEGWQLLEAWVEGVATAPRRTSEGQWQLPLHSARLPQRVEVLAAGAITQQGQPQWPPCALGGLPVQETLLSVSFPPGQERLDVFSGVEASDLAACARVREASLAALVDLPQEIVATTPAEELAAWFRPWARRLIESHEARRRLRPSDATPGKAPPLNDEWLAAARRMRVEPILKSVAASSPRVSGPLQVWQEAQDGRETVYYHARGAAPVATMHPRSPAGQRLRLLYTALAVAVCLIAIAAVRQPTVADAWRRWPQLLLAVAGLSWWLWLEPSAVGLLLIAGGLASALRSAWRPG